MHEGDMFPASLWNNRNILETLIHIIYIYIRIYIYIYHLSDIRHAADLNSK